MAEDTPKKQPDQGVMVYASPDDMAIDTCSLVLSAQGIDHRIARTSSGQTEIFVDQASAVEASRQLELYFHENQDWPPPSRPYRPTRPASAPPTVILIGSLAVFYAITGPWQPGSQWFMAGAGDATAILREGQWYRLVTALTLHADVSHLAGNCLIGGFLIHFFLQLHGTGIGLLALIISAAAGNLINVLVHGGDHHFIGFSTAVFSVIGMLASHQIIIQRQPLGLRTAVPFMAGAALLAMLGSSGVRTDLGAHLFGLISGFASGLILGFKPLHILKTSRPIQTCALLAALLLVLFCWTRALDQLTP